MNKEVKVCYTLSVIEACLNCGRDDGDEELQTRRIFVQLEREEAGQIGAW